MTLINFPISTTFITPCMYEYQLQRASSNDWGLAPNFELSFLGRLVTVRYSALPLNPFLILPVKFLAKCFSVLSTCLFCWTTVPSYSICAPI